MSGYTIGPRLAAVLAEIAEGERLRAFRAAGERSDGYTGLSRVELPNLESRSGASTVLNPPEARRFFSSRLSR